MTAVPVLPRPVPDAMLLPGRTVELVRTDPARHGAQLWHAIGEVEELWRAVPPGPFADDAAFTTWLSERASRADQLLFSLVDRRTEKAEGLYFLMNIDSGVGRAEMGLMLGPKISRQTAATEAFYILAHYVFDTLAYRRLEWRCNPENHPSMRAAERLGFKLEGVLRQNTWLKGRNWDTAVFGMIDRDWPPIAARFERWLSPDNFDSEGRQLRPLMRGS